MMKSTSLFLLSAAVAQLVLQQQGGLVSAAFSLSMRVTEGGTGSVSTRRGFFSSGALATAAVVVGVTASSPQEVQAAPEIFTTENGVKYAVTKEPKDPKKAQSPLTGDLVAIEYTGYLTNGQIFDATHAQGKNALLQFKLGDTAVITGLNEMVSNMVVGQKVQAIIPPSLAYGDKGVCLDDGECLIKPGSTLVYDIYLNRRSIPPP
mmetsp:Transcript_12927/g.23414  ORF Transcript_12927/g.23414 Transcript_12927/m.23414 type:complete len:206 (-) Transcript_12927:227-844(-)